MLLDKLTTLVGILVGLSGSSERLVAICKGFIPYLNEPQKPGSDKERFRTACLQLLSVLVSIGTVFIAAPSFPADLFPNGFLDYSHPMALITLGLLASGGASLWNSVLTYFISVKDIKRTTANKIKNEDPAMIGK